MLGVIPAVTVPIAGVGLPAFNQVAVGAHCQERNEGCKDEPVIPVPGTVHGQVSIADREARRVNHAAS